MVNDGSDANRFCLALCTTIPGEAKRIARALVEEKPINRIMLYFCRALWAIWAEI